ncbi:DNA/RNA helicase domain-containing protein [Gudongella sp. DL1XJH-153]|uniref:DNA/RNA helicase domain-containing protein n=1 Tax=Gudongella sp. DL1XJH-153 TaxID=3409804 RepID=UPI003BB59619
MNNCYANNLDEFLKLSYDDWIKTMIKNYIEIVDEMPSQQQTLAWKDCYYKTIPFLKSCEAFDCNLIFEYVLPREGGRRPDMLIISGNRILVFEFKMKKAFTQADIDQVVAYARDINSYHSESHGSEVIPIIVPTKKQGKSRIVDGVYACTPDMLEETIGPLLLKEKVVELNEWLEGEYLPLPSLIDAAQRIYNKEDLPYIRKANSAGIPEAVRILIQASETAKEDDRRILALVTGVPGAGKTLLGLDYVYKANELNSYSSIFLSGNGPLVDVLQDALKSKTFVEALRNYVKEYGLSESKIPNENIVVFDEAQRAWDREHVLQKHSIEESEAELIIGSADKIPEWSLVLGLIGEGQEIHRGEESGIEQWVDAIGKSNETWSVICPPKLKNLFKGVCDVEIFENLNLNITLRSHLADDVSKWVSKLLDEKIPEAKEISRVINEQKFSMYITRDLEKAKRYCINRYEDSNIKRYGLVCSSKAKILPRYGIDNSFNTTRQLRVGAWYNRPMNDLLSCCQLNRVATEFSCQGLELDLPIICWGEDLLWEKEKWKPFTIGKNFRDPHQIRLNSYRVLLTRGRDGFIVFVPNDRILDETYELLIKAGLRKLS